MCQPMNDQLNFKLLLTHHLSIILTIDGCDFLIESTKLHEGIHRFGKEYHPQADLNKRSVIIISKHKIIKVAS